MAIDVKELMAKVRKIRIIAGKLLDDRLSGDYHSTFKGRGVEFSEVRPYEIGDDVRSIDWNVTAKMSQPYIKRFSEERELTVMLMVDVSGSQSYGSSGRTKAELSAEVAALLALTAIKNQDKVGLVLFSDKIEKYIPPRKGRDSVMRIVREVLAAGENAEGGTDLPGAINFLNGVHKRKAVVFLVSDFLTLGDGGKMLKTASRHHDLVCVSVSDPAEKDIPNAGLVELEDPETGECEIVDTSDEKLRRLFRQAAEEDAAALKSFFLKSGIDTMELSTDKPYIDAVRALFRRRAFRRKGR